MPHQALAAIREQLENDSFEEDSFDDKKVYALVHQLVGNSGNAAKTLAKYKSDPQKYAPQIDNVISYVNNLRRDSRVLARRLGVKVK